MALASWTFAFFQEMQLNQGIWSMSAASWGEKGVTGRAEKLCGVGRRLKLFHGNAKPNVQGARAHMCLGPTPCSSGAGWGPSKHPAYKCLLLENVQLSHLPCAWHAQLPGLPEPSALQVARESPSTSTLALTGALHRRTLLQPSVQPRRGLDSLLQLHPHLCQGTRPCKAGARVVFEQTLPSLQFGSNIWRDPQDSGPEAYMGSSGARGHSSLRDKTTYLLVGSLCGTAPAPHSVPRPAGTGEKHQRGLC